MKPTCYYRNKREILFVSQGLAALTDDHLSFPSDCMRNKLLKESSPSAIQTYTWKGKSIEVKSYALHSSPQDNQDT